MQLPDGEKKSPPPLSPIAGESPSVRGSAAPTGSLQTAAGSSAGSSADKRPQGGPELDDRDFDFKFWFGDDGLVNINISQRAGLSDDMYSSLPEVSPIESVGSSLPQVMPAEREDQSLPEPLSADEPPSYTPFDETRQIAAPGVKLNIAMMVVGSEDEVRAFVDVGRWLQTTCGHRVRVATDIYFQRLVLDGGLEFFALRAGGGEIFAGDQKLPQKGSGGIRRWKDGLPDTLLSCWNTCMEASVNGVPFIADAVVANPPCLAHVHCAEALGVPMHLLSRVPWTPTRQFSHPLALIRTTDVSSTVSNMLSYAIVETMLWQQAKAAVNDFRRERLGLEPIESVFLPASLHGLNIPTTYLNSPLITARPADWVGNIYWTGPSDTIGLAARSIHNAIISAHQPCPLFPQKIVTIRSKQMPVPLSAEAVAVLSKAKALDVDRLHSFHVCDYRLASRVRDPLTGLLSSTQDTITNLLLGATAGPREAYKQSKKRSAFQGAPPVGVLHPYESVALSTAKGVGRMVTAGLKAPVTITGAVTHGFHNAPRLYGDDTVREPERVTGWKSGFVAAGKGFGQGLYDGLSGFVTQPIQGAKKEGGIGFLKGFGKGVGGLVFKPAAGAVGLPAHAFMGLYKELQKVGRTSTEAYIVASRLAACEEEVTRLGDLERQEMVLRWEAWRKDAAARS